MTHSAYVPWPPTSYLPVLASLADAMTQVLSQAPLDAAVPACPGWTVRDLATHVTHVHDWARGALLEGHPNTPPGSGAVDADAAAAAYRAAADRLLDVLGSTSPQAPCWTFGGPPRTAAFWFRRQTHEIAVHLDDARGALGRPSTVEAGLAADGVDEVVTMFFPRQVRLRRITALANSLALVADTTPYRWVLAGDGAGPSGAGRPLPDAEATVSGPADRLLLLLRRRIGLDDPALAVTGDVGAARAVLAAGLTP